MRYVCKHNMSGPQIQCMSHYAAHPIEVENVEQLYMAVPAMCLLQPKCTCNYNCSAGIVYTCVIFCSGGIFHARMHCGQICNFLRCTANELNWRGYTLYNLQVNEKKIKLETVYRDCIKMTRDKTRIYSILHDAPGA